MALWCTTSRFLAPSSRCSSPTILSGRSCRCYTPSRTVTLVCPIATASRNPILVAQIAWSQILRQTFLTLWSRCLQLHQNGGLSNEGMERWNPALDFCRMYFFGWKIKKKGLNKKLAWSIKRWRRKMDILSIFVMFTLMSKVNNLQFCIALWKIRWIVEYIPRVQDLSAYKLKTTLKFACLILQL